MKLFLPENFKLPAMPQVARECLVYLYNPNADTALIAKSLSRDIGISAQILKLANSAQFLLGKGTPTSDLKTAIFRIGQDNLRQLMVLQALETTFTFKDSYSFDFLSFSKHSSFVSSLCTLFAKKVIPEKVSEMQMAGLMHDLGLALAASLFHENFSQMVKFCMENKVDFTSAENSMGLESHGKLGARALESWEIPKDVKLIIENHHLKKPEDRNNMTDELQKQVDILILSDTLAHSYGFGFKDYKRDTRVELSMLKRLSLAPDDVKDVVRVAIETENSLRAA